MNALACQVKPDITPEEFLRVARETAYVSQYTTLTAWLSDSMQSIESLTPPR